MRRFNVTLALIAAATGYVAAQDQAPKVITEVSAAVEIGVLVTSFVHKDD